MSEEFSQFRVEVAKEFAAVRKEMANEFAALRVEIATTRVSMLRWMFALWVTAILAIVLK